MTNLLDSVSSTAEHVAIVDTSHSASSAAVRSRIQRTNPPSPRANRHRAGCIARIFAIAGAISIGFIAITVLNRDWRRAIGAALFIPDLSPAIGVRPLTWITSAPDRIAVTFGPPEAGWGGWLTLPGKAGPHPGLVVSLGVSPAGPDDPRVLEMADGLARSGVATLVPYSPNLIEGRIEPEDVAFEVAAFQYLSSREDVDETRVGMLGVCVGASLSMLAAASPEISDEVAVVAWFGGYSRLETLMAAVVSHSAMSEETLSEWSPEELAIEVVETALDDLLARANSEATAPQDLAGIQAAVDVLRSRPTYDKALEIIGSLPSSARDRLDALSPAGFARDVRAPMYLMAGADDRLVPSSETAEIAEQLGERVVSYDRFSIFTHVDLDRIDNVRQTIVELARLHRNVVGVLTEIDASP